MIYKLNLVDNDDKLLERGDAMIYFNSELEYDQLMIICPGCGELSASARKHRYSKETMSYTPSIVHDVVLGGCGWHGFLTDGVFKPC